MPKTFRSVEVRPGVVHLIDERGKARTLTVFCPDCGTTEKDALDYTTRNVIWKNYVPLDGLLCFVCLAKRIRGPEGTPEPEDFQPGHGPGQTRHRERIVATATCVCARKLRMSMTGDLVATPPTLGFCRCKMALYQRMLILDKKHAFKSTSVKDVQALSGLTWYFRHQDDDDSNEV